MRHRGAVAADRSTGDGAGLLLPIAAALVPGPWCGLAMVFLRDESARAPIERACEAEGIELAGWRTVPVDPDALGETALATMPSIEQLVLLRPFGSPADEAELRAYRARRRAERDSRARTSRRCPSARSRTRRSARPTSWRVLPGPARADARGSVRDLPPALLDEHERRRGSGRSRSASSATTARSTRSTATCGCACEGASREPGWPASLEESGSDSALLDNALELLVRGGRDVRHALRCSCRRAWQDDRELDPGVRAFHRYHAALVEPWDGPAAIVFTDGRIVGAALDRNGLRPLRVGERRDGSSPALPKPARCRWRPSAACAAVGSARASCSPSTPASGFEEDTAIARRLAGRRPYRRWLDDGRRTVGPGEPVEPTAGAT